MDAKAVVNRLERMKHRDVATPYVEGWNAAIEHVKAAAQHSDLLLPEPHYDVDYYTYYRVSMSVKIRLLGQGPHPLRAIHENVVTRIAGGHADDIIDSIQMGVDSGGYIPVNKDALPFGKNGSIPRYGTGGDEPQDGGR